MDLDLSDPGLLLRPDVLDDPRPLHDELRRAAPVWRVPGQDTYVVTEPALIRDVVARPAEFSSNLVSLLHRDEAGGLAPFPIAPLGDPTHVLATADPPVHTRHRRVLQPHLSPSAVAGLAPTLHRIVDRHLTPVLADGAGDLVARFANPVPMEAICAVIGLPAEDASRLLTLVAETGPLLDGVTDLEGMGRAGAAALELAQYTQSQVEAAVADRRHDATGLLRAFAEAIDAGAVGVAEVRDILVVLVNAGAETTSSLVAAAVEILARDPDIQEDLRQRPERIPAALEDVLRNDAPFQFHYRWTTTAANLGGVAVPADSRVLLMWAAANRPAPGDDADAAGPSGTKGQPPHYAFGRGLHFCIGAHLARLESRIALEQLLGRTRSITLDPDRPPTMRPSIFLRRHVSLPIVLREA